MRRRHFCAGLSFASLAAGSAFAQTVPSSSPPPNPQAAKLDDWVARQFSRIVLARWGDPVLPGAPNFTPTPLTSGQADTQFPYDGVIAALVAPPPSQDGIPRLVLVVASPEAPARMVFPPGQDNPTVAGRLQGVTILNLQYLQGRWKTVDGGYQSRRLSDGTLCQISGPAAQAIGGTVQGILGPSAGTATPWGNVLLTEDHLDAWLTRLTTVGYGYGNPAQAPRFGWVVEFNPLDPGSIPIKRTALGRLPRAGITATQTPDGRPVVFFTEDAPAGRLFRFVATTNATDGTALDSGQLSVARITTTGISWAALGQDVPTLAGLAGIPSGSPFDAPGGLALSHDGATLYLACAGNSARATPDALNPRAGDDNGHVIAFDLPSGDATAANFDGRLVLIAGNPATAQGTSYAPDSQAWLRKPRTLSLDGSNHLWIGTDQQGNTAQTADGFFILPVGNAGIGPLSAAYLAPTGAAAGGVAFDANSHTGFAMVRHPGATPTASFNFPATRWPTLSPGMPPQSTLIGLVGT
jgi:secreted PhoX family phosphatase